MQAQKDKRKGEKDRTRRPRILVLEAFSGSSRAMRAAGADVMSRYPGAGALDAIDNADWDGLLLTGGGDVDPRLYEKRPSKHVYGVSETRDTVELLALEEARARGVPVLGICRGAQIMNVEAGGTLRQHIGNHHQGGRHLVYAERGSTLAKAVGFTVMVVISLHHQMVRDAAEGFRISAIDPEGVHEAIESRDGRCLGVQFHPEMDSQQPYARGIFRWLAVRAARSAGLDTPPKRKPPKKKAAERGYQKVSEAAKQHRQAGSRNLAGKGRNGPVSVSFLCPNCGLRFDKRGDREDHIGLRVCTGWPEDQRDQRELTAKAEEREHKALVRVAEAAEVLTRSDEFGEGLGKGLL